MRDVAANCAIMSYSCHVTMASPSLSTWSECTTEYMMATHSYCRSDDTSESHRVQFDPPGSNTARRMCTWLLLPMKYT